jgi:leader peptidase (prepilin peptidase) / N-methyltransferase
MIWFTNLPLELRYAVLACLGLFAGQFANYLIYSWAYFPRHISPFAPPHSDALPRSVWDRIPVLGWFGLRREEPLHGKGFWIRPLLLEIGVAVALPMLYWFETQSGGLLPETERTPQTISNFASWSHALFAIHAVLFVLMVAATFIDFDEQTIPDIITLPGTLLALFAATLPWQSWLPSSVLNNGQIFFRETIFTVPWTYDPKWDGSLGLWTGWFIWTVWCFALTERHLVLRRGLWRAAGYLVHGIRRSPLTKWLFSMWIVGSILLVLVWSIGNDPWRGLLTSLVGLAVGGSTVWAIRIVAGIAMNTEAMGFGDVTLMAMIGAVVGWQCACIAFFLAPMVAIAIVLIQYLVTRQPAVPFGPYLCLGTVIAVLAWDVAWNQTFSKYVLLGTLLFWILVVSLFAMGAMLAIWRQIKRLLFA